MRLEKALEGQEEKLSHCVHCGFCLPACPTYARLGDEADSPRGRLYLMRAVVEGRIDAASDAFQTHIDRCLGCRACEPVCPSGVEYGHLLERAREAASEAREPGVLSRVLLTVVGNRILEPIVLTLSRLLRATRIPAFLTQLLPDRERLAQVRLGMAMVAASGESRSLRRAGKDLSDAREPEAPRSEPAPRGRVGLLTGCVQEGLFARVNRATARVLEVNGFEVVPVPAQGCCGALHAHGGALDRARDLAGRNIAAFGAAEIDWIVVNAAGCGATMKEYGDLLEHAPEAEDGGEISERVRDISEILAGVGPRTGGAVPLQVAYDPPCHLVHAQGVEDAPLQMLAAVPGLETVPLRNARECCGGAGSYGISHPDLGGRIGGDKVDAILESGATAVATGNPGCMMQIGAKLRMRGRSVGVFHPVEILDESYRRAGFYDAADGGRPRRDVRSP